MEDLRGVQESIWVALPALVSRHRRRSCIDMAPTPTDRERSSRSGSVEREASEVDRLHDPLRESLHIRETVCYVKFEAHDYISPVFAVRDDARRRVN